MSMCSLVKLNVELFSLCVTAVAAKGVVSIEI